MDCYIRRENVTVAKKPLKLSKKTFSILSLSKNRKKKIFKFAALHTKESIRKYRFFENIDFSNLSMHRKYRLPENRNSF